MVDDLTRMWENAIKKAAEGGRYSCRESECDRLRTPVRDQERSAARTKLKEHGFALKTVGTGPNESEWECSW